MVLDPGTALAIASMAYDVTKDLYEFYRAWKDCESDVKEVRRSLIWSKNAFEVIKDTLDRPGFSPNSVTSNSSTLVYTSLDACNDQIRAMKCELKKIRKEGTPVSILQKVKAQGRRFSYPFRKATVGHLSDLLDECKANLGLSIDLLSLNTGANTLEAIKQLDDKVDSISTTTGEVLRIAQEDQRQKMLDWLAPIDQSSIHVGKHEPGTCLWFLNGPDFEAWRTTTAALMWLHGGVGCGKSMLCSAMLTMLRRSPTDDLVVSFWFSFTGTNQQDVEAMQRSILAQIIRSTAKAFQPLHDLYQICHQSFPPAIPTTSQLQETIHSILNSVFDAAEPRKVYIVVDGLDEVSFGPLRDAIITAIQALAQLQLEHVRILILSRPESDIREGFHMNCRWKQQAIPREATDRDIETFVEHEMDRHIRLKTLPESSKSQIKCRLIGNEKNMFRWVALQLEALKQIRPLTSRNVATTLKHLPRTLDATYIRILTDIDDEYREEAYNALQWLALAARPLYVEELIEATMIRPSRALAFEDSDGLQPADMFDLLSHLIRVEPPFEPSTDILSHGVHRVELSHFSVKEFLIGSEIRHSSAARFLIDPKQSHGFIAKSCMCYLNCCNKLHSTPKKFPLLNYSWNYWPLHAVADTADFVPEQKQKASALFENVSIYQHDLHEFEVPPSIEESIYSIYLSSIRTPYFYEEYDENNHSGWYQHQPLPESQRFVRLVEIHPSTDSFTELRCSIVSVPLNEAPEFEAISHAWAKPSLSFLRVNGLIMRTMTSFPSVLRALRSMQGKCRRLMWIAGICINHQDMREKAQQMGMTGTIFAKASQVVIYLGPSTKTDVAVDVLKEVDTLISQAATSQESDLTRLRRAIEYLGNINPFLAVQDLFERHWWTRAWTLQESALATNAMLVYGEKVLDFAIVERLASHESLAKQYLVEASSDLNSKAADFFSSSTWQRVWNATITTAKMKAIPGWKPTLPVMLKVAENRSSGMKVGRMYSLKSIVEDQVPLPDWPGTTIGVYEAVSRHILETYGTLDHFSRITDKDHEFPSWVSDFSCSNRTPLVEGIFDSSSTPEKFCASRDKRVSILRDIEIKHCLGITGFLLDIVTVETPKTSIATWESECSPEESEKFGIGRHTFTTSQGRNCLGPCDTRSDDLVVVLLGGNVPYVLRETECDELKGVKLYRLIGDCIVPGFMHGEMMDQYEHGEAEMRQFLLL